MQKRLLKPKFLKPKYKQEPRKNGKKTGAIMGKTQNFYWISKA